MRIPQIKVIYGSNQGPTGVQEATICPDREFWRFLFAGHLLAAAVSAEVPHYGTAVEDADALLDELDK